MTEEETETGEGPECFFIDMYIVQYVYVLLLCLNYTLSFTRPGTTAEKLAIMANLAHFRNVMNVSLIVFHFKRYQ